MADTPPTDQRLDAIEARARAATDGPWGVYQYGGDSLIEIAADLEDTGSGYRARRTVSRFDEEPLDNDPAHREWTAEEDWAQVQADAAYIAAMSPDVAAALVAEIRRLRNEEAVAIEQVEKAFAAEVNDDRALILLDALIVLRSKMPCTCARSQGLHEKGCHRYVAGHELLSPARRLARARKEMRPAVSASAEAGE